jgi:hypothetical protein
VHNENVAPPFSPSLFVSMWCLAPPFLFLSERRVVAPPFLPRGLLPLQKLCSLALAFVHSSSPPSRTCRYRFAALLNPTLHRRGSCAAFSTHNDRSLIETEKSQSAEKLCDGRVIPEGVVVSCQSFLPKGPLRSKCDFAPARAGSCIRSCTVVVSWVGSRLETRS